MISLRYHVISIAAVFLALALGVVLGSTAISDRLLSGLSSNRDELGRQVSDLEAQSNIHLDLEPRPLKQAAPLCLGAIKGMTMPGKPGEYVWARDGEILRCPWHGWEFDLRTGKSYCEPDRIKARRFSIDVKAGREVVEGPYVAETFPVSVEEQYVVVEV